MRTYEKEANRRMAVEERLEPIYNVLKEANLLDEIDIDEFNSLVLDLGVKPHEYEKLARTVVYVRHRFVYKKPRIEAFKIAFPCRYASSDNRNTIETKAKRVEEYKIYKKIVSLLSTNLYVSYMADRIDVLDLTLKKIRDENIKERDRVEYVKIFLNETRKPDDLKGMEVNVNVTNNNISLSSIEERMKEVGSKLEGLSADKVLEVLSNGN